jgi:hypothetical protein
MNSQKALFFLGRRVERLVFGGILLFVLSFGEVYLSTANKQLVADRSTDFIDNVLRTIESQEGELTLLFSAKLEPVARQAQRSELPDDEGRVAEMHRRLGLPPPPPPRTDKSAGNPSKPTTYAGVLEEIVDQVIITTKAPRELKTYVDPSKSPIEIIRNLRQLRDAAFAKPATVWGVQAPRLVKLEYAGQPVALSLEVLSTLLGIALAPLTIGWLSALYITRQRELALIGQLEDFKDAFPHPLNLLPVSFAFITNAQNYSINSKKHADARKTNRGMLALLRCTIAAFLSFPLLAAYFYSCYQLWDANGNADFLLAAIAVFFAFVMLCQSSLITLQEWMFLRRKEFFE